MNTFSIVREAIERPLPEGTEAMDPKEARIGQVVAACQSIVDLLTPADGGRFIVGFGDIATAGTALNEHRIKVSSRPLFDASLTDVEKAVVIATFAAHEIGHTYVTAPRAALVKEHNDRSGFHAVANLADDIILEPYMVDLFPILADAFEFTGSWVLRTTRPDLPVVESGVWESTTKRFNTLLSATRYGDSAPIVWASERAEEERVWGRDWAERLIALPVRDHAGFIALCDEAWSRIRTKEETPEPEPPIIDEPPKGKPDPKGDEPKDKPDPKGDEPKGDDEGPGPDFDDEPTDDDEPKGDEPEGESKTEPTDEPKGDEDEPEPTDEGGDEPTDEPSDDEGEPKGKPEPTDESGGEKRGEDDWDPTDVEPGVDEENGKSDYQASTVEQAVNTYENTTVSRFGVHGSVSLTWS